jgi:hypothetical protein
MDQANLAEVLVAAEETEREILLTRHIALADVKLAWVLKSRYDNVESIDPAGAAQVAMALASLAKVTEDTEVSAVAWWTAGMAALDDGQMEAAIAHLERSASQFQSLGQSLAAASTQVSRFRALAMQGRYEQPLFSARPLCDRRETLSRGQRTL